MTLRAAPDGEEEEKAPQLDPSAPGCQRRPQHHRGAIAGCWRSAKTQGAFGKEKTGRTGEGTLSEWEDDGR